jgi:hypothetical protein
MALTRDLYLKIAQQILVQVLRRKVRDDPNARPVVEMLRVWLPVPGTTAT